MSVNADVSSVSPSSERKANRSDEGLTPETVFMLFTSAHLHYQLS